MFTIQRKDGTGEKRAVSADALMSACEELSANGQHPLTVLPAVSEFGEGKQIVDESAKARIETTHEALKASGISLNTKEQLYATGTRMAASGYESQRQRKAEHDAAAPIRDVAAELIETVRGESREDKSVSAKELADALHVNGTISAFGATLSEQAIRGLAARLESPMLGYVLGLRDRIAARVRSGGPEDAVKQANEADKAAIATVIRRECLNAPSTELKLRTRAHGRGGKPDVFAVVSPGYTPADAPEAVAQLIDALPRDARGTYAYDAASTSWELRAAVWTPTPVDQQAVGEPFEGYVSFQSRDNGTSRFRGGGGVTLIRCLNASTYTANGAEVARVHRGRVMYDIQRMLKGSLSAIHTLCAAWGVARAEEIAKPEKVTIEQAIPGFWRYCLMNRASELAGVLPGKSKDHIEGLTRAFFAERRSPGRLVKSDLAQGWTRYIQDLPTATRRDAESAIGGWLVSKAPVKCDLKDEVL